MIFGKKYLRSPQKLFPLLLRNALAVSWLFLSLVRKIGAAPAVVVGGVVTPKRDTPPGEQRGVQEEEEERPHGVRGTGQTWLLSLLL